MSYILDALQRADAERERGTVPGLHARQVSTPANTSSRNASIKLVAAVVAAAALGAMAVGIWFWRTPADGAVVKAAQGAADLPTQRTTVVNVASPEPVTEPVPVVASAPSTSLVVNTPSVPPKKKPVAASSLVSPAVAPAPANPSIPPLSGLPEDMRREIPSLAISGAVYSESAAQRLLLVNGMVLSQGSLVTPELRLEEIQHYSSVFSFRGHRFRVSH